MEILLLLIYSGIVWLIFFKFKLLPWNTITQVIVYIIPVVAITMLILLLNIFAPSSHDVRVMNYNVSVVPAVTGLVTEVPIEPNQHVKKGEVLFKIDPEPFKLQVNNLKSRIPLLEAKVVSAKAYDRELEDQISTASNRIQVIDAQLDLAIKRQQQTKELADLGAGSKFDYEQAQANLSNLQAQRAVAQSEKSQYLQKVSAVSSEGELSEITQARADLEQAKAQLKEAQWRLDQTVYRAPADGRVVNLQLRPGAMAVQFPITPVLTFIEDEQWLIALYKQNEIRYVQDGDPAEVALKTYPNRIIKCEVDHIVWANAQGQLTVSGKLPDTQETHFEEGRFAVRLKVSDADKDLFLAPGAVGMGAIYTEKGSIIHLVRKVIIRVGTKLDWVVPKLH
ncbi:HlyD family secretion protein [Tamlana sp. 2_MG-2023]|uniref:HlyD family secretion protein n=1 Tax=unclassified Tamlana TaxID=2614803 RepID=UPI0026E2FD66|nr:MULTISPECIES: HlyD family secretion protein [unclassified Tamlana]MDO6760399.1 HlyD family secretion protein [Tamlana sp. 2_MG-2023]MDO6789902.1 HlyD family secretion protein [Tamlana sp. 1_MG-2023]